MNHFDQFIEMNYYNGYSYTEIIPNIGVKILSSGTYQGVGKTETITISGRWNGPYLFFVGGCAQLGFCAYCGAGSYFHYQYIYTSNTTLVGIATVRFRVESTKVTIDYENFLPIEGKTDAQMLEIRKPEIQFNAPGKYTYIVVGC